MQRDSRFVHGLLIVSLLVGLCGGLTLPRVLNANAAPVVAVIPLVANVPATNIVISEFRTTGPTGGNDEFIELYNPTDQVVDISGWLVKGSNNSGSVSTRYTIPANTALGAGYHYLIVGSSYSGSVTADGNPSGTAILSSGITDTGGIAITLSNGTIIDQVGMNAGSAFKEGTTLASLSSSTSEQSYERYPGDPLGNCVDSNNNFSDFFLNSNSSNPQNSSSSPIVCAVVTNVTSTTTNGTYSNPATINIDVTFSGIVNVSGTPNLLLETGSTNQPAAYISGSGTNTLSFKYDVQVGDVSGDLDYVDNASLTLNGGTITTSTSNDADLTLPDPGTAGSLGANKNIVIDNGLNPSITSFTLQNPNSSPTSADSLTFRATFSEAVTNVDKTDFVVHTNATPPTTTATVTAVTTVSASVYDVTVSGGDLASFNGLVGLDLSGSQNIKDLAGNSLPANEPTTDQTYTVENTTAPSIVSFTLQNPTSSPTSADSLTFRATFSEAVTNVDKTDFAVHANPTTTATVTAVATVSTSVYDVTISGGDLASFNGTVGLDLSGSQNIKNLAGNSLPTGEPATDQTYTVENATGTASSLDVLINEVAWAGTSSARNGDEWIELYNTRTTTSVNLNGWRLTTDTDTDESVQTDLVVFDSNDIISAGGYFILARPLDGTCGGGTDDINIFTNVTENKCFTNQLNNNGAILRLYDAGGTLIDTANSNGGGWPFGSSSTYASMERRGKIIDTDSAWATFAGTPYALNRNSSYVKGTPGQRNWITTVVPTPTRTKTPIPTAKPVGRPIINEFLPRPAYDWNQDGSINVFDEFIEITNVGPVDINIGGWKLDDDHNGGSSPYTLPSITLKPGEKVVFYGLETNILLSDGGDSVQLLNPSNVIYDSYTYPVVKVPDQSYCRIPDGRDWYKDCVPTPGLFNTRVGQVPSMPPGNGLQPEICKFPDTLPADFLNAECNPYGTNMWSSMYWDKEGWEGDMYIPDDESKWQSFVE